MLQEPLTLYKLIILYMLDRVDFPLTTSQIRNFILEKEYFTFMPLHQAIGELTDAGMISARTGRSHTQLSITEDGKETLHFFSNQINDTIKGEINSYFKANGFALRNELSVSGEYYKSTTGEYEARLTIQERDIKLVELTMSVPLEETAASICDNWQKKNHDIYKYLTGELF